MNPKDVQNQSPPKLMQDISTPQQKPQNTDLIKTELEHRIPVRQPGQVSQAQNTNQPNPIAMGNQPHQDGQGKNDAELDNILKEVNQNVKSNDTKSEEKKDNALKKKIFSKQRKPENRKPHGHKPILITVMALFVAVGLSAAAVFAFKQEGDSSLSKQQSASPSRVGTSVESSGAVQAAGGTLVTPSDLSNLSSLLEQEVSELNDAQDFNATDLSDKNLGI